MGSRVVQVGYLAPREGRTVQVRPPAPGDHAPVLAAKERGLVDLLPVYQTDPQGRAWIVAVRLASKADHGIAFTLGLLSPKAVALIPAGVRTITTLRDLLRVITS